MSARAALGWAELPASAPTWLLGAFVLQSPPGPGSRGSRSTGLHSGGESISPLVQSSSGKEPTTHVGTSLSQRSLKTITTRTRSRPPRGPRVTSTCPPRAVAEAGCWVVSSQEGTMESHFTPFLVSSKRRNADGASDDGSCGHSAPHGDAAKRPAAPSARAWGAPSDSPPQIPGELPPCGPVQRAPHAWAPAPADSRHVCRRLGTRTERPKARNWGKAHKREHFRTRAIETKAGVLITGPSL